MLTEPVVVIAIAVLALALALALAPFIFCKERKRQPWSPSPSTAIGFGKREVTDGFPDPDGHEKGDFGPIVEEAPEEKLSRVHPNPSSPLRFTFDEVQEFTNGFSNANLLGQGGSGTVYRGFIASIGRDVAVKRLNAGSEQREREFLTEVDNLGRAHHKHVVSLVGYCTARSECIIVYEFVPNETLASHLHVDGQSRLDWSTRLKIALGSAKGLEYLHEGCNPRIIHRDVKAANILLDSKYEAKIADFGLAKCISESKSHASTLVKGTIGYVDPKYAMSGELTEKSDVYSFGVVLLELITGRKPVFPKDSTKVELKNLVAWARLKLERALKDGKFGSFIDPRLQGKYDVDKMACMVACAAACVSVSPERRPKMSWVVQALKGDQSVFPRNDGNDGIIPTPKILERILRGSLMTAPAKTIHRAGANVGSQMIRDLEMGRMEGDN